MLTREWAGNDAYYHVDAQGNVTALINSSGIPLSGTSYQYDPFGNTLSQSGSWADANPYRFSSKRIDSYGLYHYGYRFYHPDLQRWMNRDPIGEGGGINLYGFVRNQPNYFVDRDGLDIWVGGPSGPHQNICVGDPNSSSPPAAFTFGLDSNSYWGYLNPFRKGIVYEDFRSTKPKSRLIKTTPKQDAEAIAILKQMEGERWGYSITYGNCRSFAQDMFDFFSELYKPPPPRPPPILITVPPSFITKKHSNRFSTLMMQILGFRKKMAITLALIISIIACAIVIFVDLPPPRVLTQTRMNVLERLILEYAQENNTIPVDLHELDDKSLRDGHLLVDAYNRPILYSVEGRYQVTLLSYGKDGIPGGVGNNEDIIHTFSWNP